MRTRFVGMALAAALGGSCDQATEPTPTGTMMVDDRS
jgi:hypothetical protein